MGSAETTGLKNDDRLRDTQRGIFTPGEIDFMTGEKLTELFNRLVRRSAANKEKTGTETAWSYIDPDSQTHRYVVRGVKTHSEMEDDILNVIVCRVFRVWLA